MGEACREAGVEIVAGDTKVVERGHLDKLFITTTGVGWRPDHVELGYHRIESGDHLLVNGPPGEHGVAVLAGRYDLELDSRLKSDLAPLNGIVEELLALGPAVKLMRDLTRGGLATAVKEIALPAGVDVFLEEEAVPVSPEVRGAARLLGLDPLYLASEGKFLAVVARGEAEAALEILRGHPLGRQAAVIGEVTAGKGDVYLKTPFGGTKILDFLAGDPLPRIC